MKAAVLCAFILCGAMAHAELRYINATVRERREVLRTLRILKTQESSVLRIRHCWILRSFFSSINIEKIGSYNAQTEMS